MIEDCRFRVAVTKDDIDDKVLIEGGESVRIVSMHDSTAGLVATSICSHSGLSTFSIVMFAS